MQRPPLTTLIFTGFALWLAIATLHDLAGVLLRPIAPHVAWLFP